MPSARCLDEKLTDVNCERDWFINVFKKYYTQAAKRCQAVILCITLIDPRPPGFLRMVFFGHEIHLDDKQVFKRAMGVANGAETTRAHC